MSDIVIELQKDLVNTSKKLSEILPKAYLIAEKLKLNDFSAWVKREMNGYSDEDEYPVYRQIRGVVKCQKPFYGWEKLIFQDEKLEKQTSLIKNNQSISALENLLSERNENIDFSMPLPSSFSNLLNPPLPCAVFIDASQITGIITQVRTRLLDWILELEKNGIKGENMEFLEEDIKKAQGLNQPQVIFNGDIHGGIQMAQGNHTVAQTQNNQKSMEFLSMLWNGLKKLFVWIKGK